MLRKGGHEVSGGLRRRAKLLPWASSSASDQHHPFPPPPSGTDNEDEESPLLPALVLDLLTSLFWVLAGAAARVLAYGVLHGGEALRGLFYIGLKFAFGWLSLRAGGGFFNPLTMLACSMSGGLSEFRPILAARILSQVVGYGFGAGHVLRTFPEAAEFPRPSVDVNRGALTEGLLAFVRAVVCLRLKEGGSSFYTSILVTSVTKLILESVAKDLTGGWMNPARAFGWAFAEGTHMTMEHLYVYWFAPISGTLLAIVASNNVVTAKHRRD